MNHPPFILSFLLLSSATFCDGSPRTFLLDSSSLLLSRLRSLPQLPFPNPLGGSLSLGPFDRVNSQPVFAVTTPYGSPYLLNSMDEDVPLPNNIQKYNPETNDAVSDEEIAEWKRSGKGDNREKQMSQVALYFMDEDDALKLRDEMLNMDAMKDADMRISSVSLGKAVKHSSNAVGQLTGAPVDYMTGALQPEGGCVLRYRIVPSRRELFYAARCAGSERVGLLDPNPVVNANFVVNSNHNTDLWSALKGFKSRFANERKRVSEKGQSKNSKSLREDYAHMEGNVGVPVFHSPSLQRKNRAKWLGRRMGPMTQSPLFFSYEDLIESWEGTANRFNAKMNGKKAGGGEGVTMMSEKPDDVEVYNMMDILVSMDKERWTNENNNLVKSWDPRRIANMIPIVGNRLATVRMSGSKKNSEGRANQMKESVSSKPSILERVVFVPSSMSCRVRNNISKKGSLNPRLKAMRQWGLDA